VRAAAESVAKKVVKQVNAHAVSTVLPIILAAMEPKNTWQTKVLACELVGVLSRDAPKQMAIAMPVVFPVVSHTVSDAKVQVKVSSCQHMLFCAFAALFRILLVFRRLLRVFVVGM
jgi:hypothetical protein